MLLLLLLVTVSFAAGGLCMTADMNLAADSFLRNLSVLEVAGERRTVALEDFRRSYRPLGWGWPEAEVSCADGWARDMSTLVRTGDATIASESDWLVLRAKVGMTSLEFGFNSCQVRLKPLFRLDWSFSATVHRSSADVAVRLAHDGRCRAELLGVDGDLTVRTGGSGILDMVKDRLLTVLAQRFRERILVLAREELDRSAQQLLQSFYSCHGY